MPVEILQPLKVKNSLANNPKQNPIYSQKVKLKNGEEVEFACPKSTRALVALMDMQAALGGAASHFGGPSAFAEIMSALYGLAFYEAEQAGRQWYDCFHLINDAGHCENGIYALKANYGFADLTIESLKGFRSINSQLTGHGEAHLFPEGVYLSNGPLGSSVSQAQGLCYADALSGHSDRITVTAISDGACMEGEAKEALAAIPGLASKGKMSPFVLIISDNNTKLTGRIDEEAFSMTPTFESLNALGWNVVTLESAHDLQSCVTTFEEVFKLARENPAQPIAVHAKTIKGYGTKKTMESASGGHGFPLKSAKELPDFIKEIYGDASVPKAYSNWINDMLEQENSKEKVDSQAKEKIQVGVSRALIDKRAQGLPVVSISADLPGSTGMADFQKKYPESSVDLGVAEANMVSMAAGLAKQGYIPVVDTFSQFGTTKGALPLIMSSLSLAPVIAIFSHAGFQDAADGASHQSLSYFSMTSSIPHVETYSLTTSEEAYELISQAVDDFAHRLQTGEHTKSYVFFLGRETFPSTYINDKSAYKLGHAQLVFDGVGNTEDGKATIVAAGPLLHQALAAAMELETEGIKVNVVNPSIINKPDTNLVRSCLRNTNNNLLTVEDHQVVGGMGALLSHALLREGQPIINVKSLGVNGNFGQSAYTALDLYKKHGLDKEAIKTAVKSFVD